MPEAKGMWEGLMDFSFRVYATPRMLKFLYAMHLLVGRRSRVGRGVIPAGPSTRLACPARRIGGVFFLDSLLSRRP
jgi:hypothetical protein